MNRYTKKILLCAILLFGFCRVAGAALYVPDVAAMKGIGGATAQAVTMDLRALEAAAMVFASEEPDTAASLGGGNHIELLAKHTDVPSKFTAGGYSFYVVGDAWWIGAAVPNDPGRDKIASSADSAGFYGSSDVDTPPQGDALFQNTDGAVWKKAK